MLVDDRLLGLWVRHETVSRRQCATRSSTGRAWLPYVPLLEEVSNQLLITLGISTDLLSALGLHELAEQSLAGSTVIALGFVWQHRADLQ